MPKKLAYLLQFLFSVMNPSDFLIIYLACGAPCGVYFFLQNRKKLSPSKLWLKSFLTVIVWIPYAFNLLHDFATKKSLAKNISKQSALSERIAELQKQFSALNFKASSKISTFEIREVFDRYAELTLICNSEHEDPEQAEVEIFRIALRKNSQPGANCLHRRNRQRLLFHQTLARRDFLQILIELKSNISDQEQLKNLAFEFAEVLGDIVLQEKIAEIFSKSLQSADDLNVQYLEKDIWKSKEHKPSPANQIPVRLQALTATATAATKKD